MGSCLSAEAARHDGLPVSGPDSKLSSTAVSVASVNSNVQPGKLSMLQNSSEMRASPVIQKVRAVLAHLSDISVAGYSSDCNEACEVLQQALEQCDMVSLYAYKCGTPSVCVLAGAAGVGADVLQQQLITSGSKWSAPLCCMQMGTPYLFRTVKSTEDVKQLPQDWAALHNEAGLMAFLAMHITVAGQDTPIGVLTLGSKTPGAFMDSSLALQLGMITTGIVPLLTSPWLSALTTLACQLKESRNIMDNSFTTFAASFLEGSAQLLEATTHMTLGVRLGLLDPEQQEVMLMHRSSSDCSSNASGSFLRQGTLDHGNDPHGRSSSVDCDVSVVGEFGLGEFNGHRKTHVTPQQLHMEVARLPAEQTLLLQAIESRQPQFVADISAYLEQDEDNTEFPCADLVDLGDEHLASIVVMPLYDADGAAVGGLYVTYQRPGKFLQDNAVVNELAVVLKKLLVDQLTKVPEFWEEFQVSPGTSESSFALVGPSTPTAAGPSAAIRSSKSNTRLAVLHPVWQREDQQQLVCGSESYISELEIHSVLGQGGFSTVYAGSWHGSRTAIKVMPAATDKLGINMKAAMEMAALSTLRHPNIVRTYACLTEMVEDRAARHVSADNLSPIVSDLRFRKATNEDYAAGKQVFNILVMERCDRGCLWSAVRQQNLLHKKLPDGRSRINMRLLYNVLLDVATSLKYLHNMDMIHCDLKAENIIMESSGIRAHGFTCKLADFGLVKLLNDDGLVPNNDTSGTLTHFAPERFKAGGMIGEGVDVFSFGVMMYELYSGQKPYAGMQPGPALAKGILHGLRPQFPSSTPAAYRQLAEACWAADPAVRPSMDMVVSQLQEMLESSCRPAAQC